ncbi:MAG TPA: rod shape-determining protein MreD [Vicinamibacteria bacterium]|nr:rod shape-determining protein MreD [Vicinamibacteria bacterium]
MRTALALLVFGGGVAQATVVPVFRLGHVVPDLPLVMVVLLALRRGPVAGCAAGFVAGLVQDSTGGGLIGVQALTKALVGFAIGSVAGRLRATQPLVQVPGLVVLSLAEGLARFALLQLFHFPAPFGELMTYVIVPQALYNGFLGALLAFGEAGVQAVRARVS